MNEVQELFNAGLLSKSECDRRLAEVSQCHAQQVEQAKHAHAVAHRHPERQWQSMPDVTMVTAGAATRSQNKADMIALLDLETREQVCRKDPVRQTCCTQKRPDSALHASTDILTWTRDYELGPQGRELPVDRKLPPHSHFQLSPTKHADGRLARSKPLRA